MQRTFALMLGLIAGAAYPMTAAAHQVEFVSPHPVPHKFGGGFCSIEVAHIHNYQPADPRLYRQANGRLYFVGDPSPFGYDGPRYTYYGSHPVPEAQVHFGQPVFCYLKGPHAHWYQPPQKAQFHLSGGAYWYLGAFPRSYYDERPRYAVVNDAYAPVLYTRPVVDVAVAPPAVQAHISLGGPGWGAHAVIGTPVQPVAVLPPPPPPPPPPAPVAGPAVQIGVGIHLGAPGPVMVAPAGVIYEDHHHGRPRHDHGRHAGWRNQPHVEKHRGRPARFIAGPAPVTQPLLERSHGRGPSQSVAPARIQPGRGRGVGPAFDRGRRN